MNSCLAILLCVALLPASPGQERQLRLAYDDVTAQAQALIETVNSMEANLREQGLILHPEIASARNHLKTALDRASDALDRHDWKDLSKSLNRARGWIERLQSKL
jgi:uncharacterized membrane protein YccC